MEAHGMFVNTTQLYRAITSEFQALLEGNRWNLQSGTTHDREGMQASRRYAY